MILGTLGGLILAGAGLALFGLVRAGRGARVAHPGNAERALGWIAFGSALAVSLALLVVPTYESARVTLDSSGQRSGEEVHSRMTLVQVNGPAVLIPLGFPPAVAGIPLLFRRSRWRAAVAGGAAAMLGAFVFLAGFTIGLAYVPCAAALLAAAVAANVPAGR